MSKKKKSNLTREQRLLNAKVFVHDAEIVKVKVLYCAWDEELNGTIQEAIQTDFDFFFAVDHQNDETPFIRYGFLKENIEIIKP